MRAARGTCHRCGLQGWVRHVVWAAGTLSEILCPRCQVRTVREREPMRRTP